MLPNVRPLWSLWTTVVYIVGGAIHTLIFTSHTPLLISNRRIKLIEEDKKIKVTRMMEHHLALHTMPKSGFIRLIVREGCGMGCFHLQLKLFQNVPSVS